MRPITVGKSTKSSLMGYICRFIGGSQQALKEFHDWFSYFRVNLLHPLKSIFKSMTWSIIHPTAHTSKGWPLCAVKKHSWNILISRTTFFLGSLKQSAPLPTPGDYNNWLLQMPPNKKGNNLDTLLLNCNSTITKWYLPSTQVEIPHLPFWMTQS